MPEINLVDANLKNYNDTAELSIQVNLNGFSFCIHSSEDQHIHAFRHYAFPKIQLQEDMLNQIDEILYKDELLRLNYKKVRVIYTGRKSTLVPDEFFRTDNLKQILEFNQPIDALDEIHYNAVPACQSQLVFAIPTYFAGLVAEKFKEAHFYNQATPLLISALAGEETAGTEKVIVQLSREFFDIIIISKGKLRLYNTFLYVGATDLIYFILYACKQLKVDIKKTPFYFTGEFDSKESLMREVAPHIPSVKFFTDPEYIRQKPLFKKLDYSRFYSLLQLPVCE